MSMTRYDPDTGHIITKKPRTTKKPRLSKGAVNTIKVIEKINKDSATELYPILKLSNGMSVGLPVNEKPIKMWARMLREPPPEHVYAETRRMLADSRYAEYIINVHMALWGHDRDRAIHDLLWGIK
jgi:hypothetical protein